jgi:hypothetical protein
MSTNAGRAPLPRGLAGQGADLAGMMHQEHADAGRGQALQGGQTFE